MSQKNNKLLIFSIIAIIIIGISIYFVSNKKVEKTSKTYYYLGTVSEVTILNETQKKSDDVLKKSDDILKDIHNKMSAQQQNTEVDSINNNAGIKPIEVSYETFNVIESAIKYSEKTNGIFDPSIGSISSLWQIGTENAKVPSDEEIKENIKFVNYKNIIIDKNKKSVFLKEKGMRLDLGAIAKGYAADLIADMLNENNISSAIINLGGNVFVVGNKSGSPFKIGIQAPYEERSTSIGYIEGEDTSVVTSGIYERYIKENDKIYHHMLNPSNGYPFDNNLNSVTIVSKKSIDGDALSTSSYGMGLENGMKFIESQNDVGAIFVTKDKKIYLSKDMKSKFILTDDSYKIAN